MDNMDTLGTDNRWGITKLVGSSNLNLVIAGTIVGVGSIATYKLGEWTIEKVRERRADKASKREAETAETEATADETTQAAS